MSRRFIGRRAVALALTILCTQLTVGGELFAQTASQAPDETQSKQPSQPKQPQDAAPVPKANPRIAELIKDLDSDDFQTRQRASRELEKLGSQVIPQVTKALESASTEVKSRCMLLMARFLGSGGEPTRQAAWRALKQLQNSKDPTAARFAKDLLARPSPAVAAGRLQILRAQGGRAGRAGGAVQGAARAANGFIFAHRDGNGSLIKGRSSTDNNGVKSINVVENGKTIDVKQNPQGAIKVKVTQSVEGKPQVTHYAADSEDELKKKHPEGHKTYKHVQSLIEKSRVLQLPARQQVIQRARGRGFARPNPATQARSLQQAQQQIDAALKQMRALIKQTPLPTQEIQKQIEQIDAARNTLEELSKQLVMPTEKLPTRFRSVPQAGEPPAGTKGR